jgi:hypothetical protein
MSWTIEKAIACLKGDKEISPEDKKLLLKFFLLAR